MQLSLRDVRWAAVPALLAAACGGAVTEQVVGPAPVRCQIGVGPPSHTVPAAGSSLTLSVDATRDCTWTATTNTAWVQVTPASGQGSGAITVAVAANADTRPRAAAVTVNDTTVGITQEALPCRFDLSPQRARFNPDGGRTAIRVATTNGCEWRASGGTTWLRVLTERGAGPGEVELEASRNDGPERSTRVSIADVTLEVAQDSISTVPPAPGPPSPAPPAPPPPPPIVCTYAIESERASFRSAGGPGSVRVVTEPGCSWTASTQVPWVSVGQPGGTGPGTLPYVVSANTSTVSDRAGTLTVAGRTHSVSQQACAVALDPASQTFGSPGGGGAIRVGTEPGCTWAASSGASWIALSRSNGSGPDTLTYQVAVYTERDADRASSIDVAGRTHSVRQTAFRPEEIGREGTLSNVSGSCPSFSFTVGDRVFVTDQRTKFDAGCDKIRNGARAFVRGELLPDGRVLATQVDIDD
jgi:hypothetical protein